MQLYVQLYHFSQDVTVLQRGIELLRRAVVWYTHWDIDNTKDNKIHLPTTFSPEYAKAPDCNYDLSLYRWGLETYISLCESISSLECVDDTILPVLKDRLARLVDYPQGDDGFWIGAGTPLSSSHRHFSHLMMIFPLRTLDLTEPGNADIAARSVDHWLGMGGALTGFCRTAASPMNVMLGRRSAAFTNITYLVDAYILPNTFYREVRLVWNCLFQITKSICIFTNSFFHMRAQTHCFFFPQNSTNKHTHTHTHTRTHKTPLSRVTPVSAAKRPPLQARPCKTGCSWIGAACCMSLQGSTTATLTMHRFTTSVPRAAGLSARRAARVSPSLCPLDRLSLALCGKCLVEKYFSFFVLLVFVFSLPF